MTRAPRARTVLLPDGTVVRARALRDGGTAAEDPPDFGVYLTVRPHREAWESRWVRWPDFGLPGDPADLVAALREAHRRAADERVEIACGGGRGRTGTALAVLARLAGVPAEDAVDWVRRHHDPCAVETPWQRRFVRRLDLDEPPTARWPRLRP